MARLLLDVVGTFTPPFNLIVLILTAIGGTIGFYKVITDKAKLEADLRNEIKKHEEELKEMRRDFDNFLTKLDFVTGQLQTVADQGRRVTALENTFEKIERKMDNISNNINSMKDQFNEKLSLINVNMERKQDKPR